jgi:hypothetical protein
MKDIFYLANSIYQFAYAIPIYRELKGAFVVPTRKKKEHFLREFKNYTDEKGVVLPMPDIQVVPRDETHLLKGVLLFLANTINPNADYSNAITLFHEHGTSDKKYENGNPIALKKLSKYNYILLSGPKNKFRLEDIGLQLPAEKLIPVGCLRFEETMLSNKFRQRALQSLKIKDTQKKNILYAPTWKFGEGTFRKFAPLFIQKLTPTYNLILRPHYHDRRFGRFLFYVSKMLGIKNLYYSAPESLFNSDTYAAFAASDLLISDISSVIYEYLFFKKPIIIAKNNFANRHQMHNEFDIMDKAPVFDGNQNIVKIIAEELENKEQLKNLSGLHQSCFYLPKEGAVSESIHFIKQLQHAAKSS